MRWLRVLTVGRLATLAAVIIGVLLYRYEPLPVKVVRNAVFDQYQRWQPRDYTDQQVRIVDIDDESLRRIGQWPWPRTQVADLVRKLQDAGAAAIGFDMMFAEADRTSPQSMAALWNVRGETRTQLLRIPDHDQVMAEALRGGRVVLGFAGKRDGEQTRLPAKPSREVYAGPPALPFLNVLTGADAPLAVLEQASTGIGAFTFFADTDSVVRRVPLLMRMCDPAITAPTPLARAEACEADPRGTVVPSLSAELLRVSRKQRNYHIATSPQAGLGVEAVRVANVRVPVTASGEVWVHYTEPVPKRYIPAWQVLGGQYATGSLDNHIVLIGTSALGLRDLRSNPLGAIMPGVEAHAQVLEQIREGKYLARSTQAKNIEALIIIIGGLIVGIVALTTRALVSAAFTATVLGGIGLAAWLAFTREGLLLDPVTPGLTLLITFLVGSVVRHMSSEREQRWVRDAFSRYVSPNRVAHLVNNPGQLELGGRRQECSFVFTDLEDFTGLMEKMDPAAAVSLLNAYLDRMVAIAFNSGGTLDRIVGDAVAIMFSAPVHQPDHRERAYQCALEMHAFASRYSAELHAKGTPFGKTRIGVHTGEVIVGNFGGSTMFDYRALGDPVNTAARLEGANKYLGTTVCVSEATLSGVNDAVVRTIGRLVVKGKTQALTVYEPVITTNHVPAGRDTAYDAAFALLQQSAAQAPAAFEQLARERASDTLVAFHLARLRAGAVDEQIKLDEK